MSRDLHELLTETSVTPRRPVDVAHIRNGVRRRRRTRQGLFGVLATLVVVTIGGIVVAVVPEPPEDVVLDSPPPVVASEPTVEQPLPSASPRTESEGNIADDELSASEQALLDAFVAFAKDPNDTTAAAVPWANEVKLHLGNQPAQAAVFPENRTGLVWSLDAVAYEGYSGPLDAREYIAETTFPLTYGAGPHKHCASPPVPAPDGLADLRRLWIQPTGISTCLDWFTVDLFINGDGQVAAVSLDLFGP
ncbi:hypothetical protein BH24ACT15_BH24ACT15_12530 [soil metagenome]